MRLLLARRVLHRGVTCFKTSPPHRFATTLWGIGGQSTEGLHYSYFYTALAHHEQCCGGLMLVKTRLATRLEPPVVLLCYAFVSDPLFPAVAFNPSFQVL